MKKRKRRKKRTSGNRLLALVLLLLLPSVFAEKKKAAEPYGLVAGTVFHEPGFILPGAEVTLAPNPETGDPPKWKKQKFTTDARGEFAFRVPVMAMRYALQASARGYTPQEKNVSIQGENHIEVTFVLTPESKK